MTQAKPNIGKIQNRYDALRVAREWLDEVRTKDMPKKEDVKKGEEMRITSNPEIRPKITKLYTACDVLKKAIAEDPIASKLPAKGQKALIDALSTDPDIQKKIG